MDAIFEAYLAAQRRRRASALTLKTVAHTLRSTQRWLDQQGIAAAELSLLDCEQFFDTLLERGAVATARRHLTYVRAAYRYALRHGTATHDPTIEVKLPRLPDHEPETYSNDELRLIHAAIRDEREEAAFFLLAFAGLRLGEVAALTWPQADLGHSQLRLTGKAGKFRLVPLHPVLLELLREHKRRARGRDEAVILTAHRRPLAAPTLGRTIRTLVDRADVEVASPAHAFRRTVATVMYENGVRTRVIERIMGWAPRQMHERHYLRVANEPMHHAILTLYHDDPISDRQTAALQTRPLDAPAEQTGTWLGREHARLDELETRLGINAR